MCNTTNVKIDRWYKVFSPSEIEFLVQLIEWRIKGYERLGKLFNTKYNEADEYKTMQVNIISNKYITTVSARELEACIYTNMLSKNLQEYMAINNFKSTAENIRQKLYSLYYKEIDYEALRKKDIEYCRKYRERKKLNIDHTKRKKINKDSYEKKKRRQKMKENSINNFCKELKELLGA